MKEKIYKYLADTKSTISTAEIIDRFFHVPGKYPSQMESIIDNMLQHDGRFARDGFGGWSIRKSKERLLNDIMFSIVELETVSVDRNKKLPLFTGIAQVQNLTMISSQIYSIETPLHYSPRLKQIMIQHKKSFAAVDSFNKHAPQIYRSMQNTILIHHAPSMIISTLNYFFRSITGMELEMEFISLTRLIRKLFRGTKIRSIEDIARALNIRYQQPLDLTARINLTFDILIHVIEKLSDIHITTFESLTSYLETGERLIDFSNYKFDQHDIKNLPQTPGVYLMKDRCGKVFYVGKSRNLKSRIESYFIDRTEQEKKTNKILTQLYDLKYELVGSELEALLKEHEYIQNYQPELNTQIKIHPLDLSDFRQKNVILFLPGLSEDQIVLFFVKGTAAAKKIQLNRSNANWRLCDQMLAEFFYHPRLITSDYTDQQIEIIWRWFKMNQQAVNFMDVDQAGDQQDCLDKIKRYVADDNLLTEKISYLF